MNLYDSILSIVQHVSKNLKLICFYEALAVKCHKKAEKNNTNVAYGAK